MRVAFWGNFGTLNLGNECTLAAAVSNVRTRLPDGELTAICVEPADTAARHGIASIPMSEPRLLPAGANRSKLWRRLRRLADEALAFVRALREASRIDVLLITGCGILSDHDEGTLGLPYELFKWSLAVKLRRKKLFFLSVGAESIDRPISRAFIKGALGLADYRSYRDLHSMQRLQRLGIRTDRDVICPDLAFSLSLPAASTHGDAPADGGGLRRRWVAVGLFNYRGRALENRADEAAYQAYLDHICSLILWLLAHEYGVRVVIGDLAFDPGVRSDVRAGLARRGLELNNPWYADEMAVSFEQVMQQLSTVDFVIASRYHNVLLALLLGKPALSMSYEAKNEALMSDLGLGDYCQTLDELDLEQLLQQFQRLERNADSLRALMAERAAANRASLGRQYDLVAGSIQ